jgi:hypothetical protein
MNTIMNNLHLALIVAQRAITDYIKPIIDAVQGCVQDSFQVLDIVRGEENYTIYVMFGGDLRQVYSVPISVLESTNPITAAIEWRQDSDRKSEQWQEERERKEYLRLHEKYGSK